jgi:hypothetical protein
LCVVCCVLCVVCCVLCVVCCVLCVVCCVLCVVCTVILLIYYYMLPPLPVFVLTLLPLSTVLLLLTQPIGLNNPVPSRASVL